MRRPLATPAPVRALLATSAALIALLAGCGDGDGRERAATPVALALDFTPNAVHAPVYAAVREGFDRAHGVDIRIRPPGSAPDSLKLIESGRVDVGILDIHDLGLARERGVDLVGVGALVQRPLAAIVARAEVKRPRDLAGRRVGVSGLPSDPAVLRAVVEGDGGDYRAIRQVTIGFAAVPSLIERKVAAVPVFWNAEGVALRERGVKTSEFRVDDYGAPPYPEVVLIVTRKTLEQRRALVEGVVAAIAEGTRSVLADPEAAVRDIVDAGGGDARLVRAQVRAVRPVQSPPLRLDRRVLERWADFDARFGILERRPDVARTFAFGLER